MRKPSWFKKEKMQAWKKQAKQVKAIAQKSNLSYFVIALFVFAVIANLWDAETTSYAQAFTGSGMENNLQSPIFEKQNQIFIKENSGKIKQDIKIENIFFQQIKNDGKINSSVFAQKIYEIVGETPIKEMVPFISLRDEKVAAFLVGIAKKESSFGLASPSKDGKDCYNYWGYKGEGGRGTGMGYACFTNAEEAIKIVGDRIEVLVNKQRNTPERMVDTWKCGKSCQGDPGASGWVKTVALYFEKIVG